MLNKLKRHVNDTKFAGKSTLFIASFSNQSRELIQIDAIIISFASDVRNALIIDFSILKSFRACHLNFVMRLHQRSIVPFSSVIIKLHFVLKLSQEHDEHKFESNAKISVQRFLKLICDFCIKICYNIDNQR